MSKKENISIYFTDGFNPPRQLLISDTKKGGGGGGPFDNVLNDIDTAGLDSSSMDIYSFSTSFEYSQGSNVTVVGSGDDAIFSNVAPGTEVYIHGIAVDIVRANVKSHFDYDVEAGTNLAPLQRQDFTYDLCNKSNTQLVRSFFFSPKDSIDTESAPNYLTVTARRTGGFVVYYPCSWYGDNQPSIRRAYVKGTIAIKRGASFETKGKVQVLYPPATSGESLEPSKQYIDEEEPLVTPDRVNPEGVLTDYTDGGAPETSSVIDIVDSPPLQGGKTFTGVLIVAGYYDYLGTIEGWERVYTARTRSFRPGVNEVAPVFMVFTKELGGWEQEVTINWEGPQLWASLSAAYENAGDMFVTFTGEKSNKNTISPGAPPPLPFKNTISDYPGTQHLLFNFIQDFHSSSVQYGSEDDQALVPLTQILNQSATVGDVLFSFSSARGKRLGQSEYKARSVAPVISFPGINTDKEFGIGSLLLTIYPAR